MSIRIFRPAHPTVKLLGRVAVVGLCLSLTTRTAILSAQIMEGQHRLRELSGAVTSPQHEPLRGAVVELQEVAGGEVESYITAEDGRYHFKRLSSEADYKVWVIFRNRHSKSRDISKFDDHLDKVINFTIETF